MFLSEKILTIYPTLSMEDFSPFSGIIAIQNDGDDRGDYIAAWNHPTLSKPTQAQLDALENVEYRRILTKENYSNVIQEHIDSVAQSKEYADGTSLATYIISKNPKWKSEAEIFVDWRDSVWTYVFDTLKKVQSGQMPAPSIEELILQLPVIRWS